MTICLYCFQNIATAIPWCKEHPGFGCQYGLRHSYGCKHGIDVERCSDPTCKKEKKK